MSDRIVDKGIKIIKWKKCKEMIDDVENEIKKA